MPGPEQETRYADHMAAVGDDDFEMAFFTWRRALLSSYDIFHLHWPEQFVRSHEGLKGRAAAMFTSVLLLRLRLMRTPVVRTVHNIVPHDESTSSSRRYAHVATAFDRLTVADIHLVPEEDLSRPQPSVLIPHGDYSRPFAHHPRRDSVPGRLLYFGLIKKYKGVDTLLSTFSATSDPKLSLRIVGRPSGQEAADLIDRACADDARITSVLAFVADADLVAEITASSLVVLPYSEMHSSGSVIVALSLGRPVLVPNSGTGRALQDEVGPDWVHLFDSVLTKDRLEEVLREVGKQSRGEFPQMPERDWDVVAARHRSVYSRLVH